VSQCLWCGNTYFPPLQWAKLFSFQERSGFCGRCRSKLHRLEGPDLCAKCGRDLKQIPSAFVSGEVCTDCRKWQETNNPLLRNRSLFSYNAFMREVMTRFKFRGDAILIEAFHDEWRALYKRHFKGCIPVPIPLSAERLAERHFNQAELLANCLPVPPAPLLIRPKHTEKQSKKSRSERLSSGENPFALSEDASMYTGKRFVIIDDIYTTGTTVRYAARALSRLKPAAVFSMCLAR